MNMGGVQTKIIRDGINFIISSIADRTGNNFFGSKSERNKIKKIIFKDRKNIQKYFNVKKDTELYNLVEQFIIYTVHQKGEFFSTNHLSAEEENNLWKSLCDYLRSQNNDKYINLEYKDKIIKCVNEHNALLSEIFLDEQSKIHIKMMTERENKMEKNIKDEIHGIKKIINTLDTETFLQMEDEEIDFSIAQLESIMQSYRYDIVQLRKQKNIVMIALISAIFLGMFLFVICFPISEFDLDYIMLILMIMFNIIFFVGNYTQYGNRRLSYLENQLEKMRLDMWKLNYNLYKNKISNKNETFDKNDVEILNEHII